MARQPLQNVFPQYGVVTSVEGYRVKVYLPLLDIETDYIRVGSQYVGPGWGLHTRPHAGNEALVVFANGDINAGHVVCLWWSEDCDPAPDEGDNFTLVHESGSVLRFDQDGNVLFEAKGILTLKGVKVNIN